ncbi:hypothetical protein DITRI_Ditri01bG0147200 [Diplodiscus trichospermus]
MGYCCICQDFSVNCRKPTGSWRPTPSQPGQSDRDKIILLFGKIGKDMFTMDHRYPLFAFQASAIERTLLCINNHNENKLKCIKIKRTQIIFTCFD